MNSQLYSAEGLAQLSTLAQAMANVMRGAGHTSADAATIASALPGLHSATETQVKHSIERLVFHADEAQIISHDLWEALMEHATSIGLTAQAAARTTTP